MIKLKSLITEKTLYHGTTIDNVGSIKKYGLTPLVGEFVKTAYDMSGYGEDIDPDDYFKELVFATDKKQLDKALTAMTAQIAYKLKKDFHDITDGEIERYGVLVVIKNGDSVMQYKKNDDGRENHPYMVEPEDYYSDENISVDYVLTGSKMILVLKRYGIWPRYHAFGNIDPNNMKTYLIGLAIKKNPTKSKEEIIKIINSWDEKTLKRYYSQNKSR